MRINCVLLAYKLVRNCRFNSAGLKAMGLVLVALSFASCLPKQQMVQQRPPVRGGNAPRPGIERLEPMPGVVNSTAQAYISQYKEVAIQEMGKYGIPASIKLAQALLESGNGNSTLARLANNHFGIKCSSGWTGKRMLKDDDRVDDCFRVYQNPEESFRDHSEFLLKSRYAALFELDKNDYVGWARGLKRAGYATNPRYAELLINLIERYELYRYDTPESLPEKLEREEKVFQEIAHQPSGPQQETLSKEPVQMLIHEVKQGDTLFGIASLYGLSVELLKALNGIQEERLMPGQLLVVSE